MRREQLKGVQGRIDEIVRDLKTNQTLLMKDAVKTSFEKGIEGGIGEFGQDWPPLLRRSLAHRTGETGRAGYELGRPFGAGFPRQLQPVALGDGDAGVGRFHQTTDIGGDCKWRFDCENR